MIEGVTNEAGVITLCTIPTPGAISDFSKLHVGKYGCGVWTVSLETGVQGHVNRLCGERRDMTWLGRRLGQG